MRNKIDLIFIKLSDYLSNEDYTYLVNYVDSLKSLLSIYIQALNRQNKKVVDLREYIDKLERSI